MLDLKQPHFMKMAKGKSIQLKPTMMGSGMKLKVMPSTAKKISKAKRLNKGCRLCMTEEEMTASGIKDIFKKIAKWYGEVVRPSIGPSTRKFLKKGGTEAINAGLQILGAMTGQPEIVAAARAVSPLVEMGVEKAVDRFGDWSGAFGLDQRVMMRPMSGRTLNSRTYSRGTYNYGDLQTGNIILAV